MSDESLEVPEADAVEQETDAVPGPADPIAEPGDSTADLDDVPLEADPADVVDQAREVETDDTEDYR
jgi:hypothetical protein